MSQSDNQASVTFLQRNFNVAAKCAETVEFFLLRKLCYT